MIIPVVTVVFNWRGEENKSGVYSIHLRVTIDRTARYYRIEVPRKVAPAQWSGAEDAWVKPSHPFSFEINSKIREKKAVVLDLIKRSYNHNKNLDFATVFAHLRRRGDRHSFYEYMRDFIRNPPEPLQENTIKKYNTCLLHLQGFKKQLCFSDIDHQLVKEFHRYLHSTLKLEGATCKKYLEALKRVVRQARRENYLDPSQLEFLFDEIRVRVNRPRRTFLEPEEIKRWKALRLDGETAYLERDRDLFLFQIYTGYYYKDLLIFRKSQLLRDEQYGLLIVGARDKNGNGTLIPLFKFPHAAAILKKYGSAPGEITVFDPSVFIEEPAYNRNLKALAKLAGIAKSVSNKVARHTNAQLWVRYGAESPLLSKMMGHRKQETTKSYYEVDIPEMVEGTRRVDFTRLGI